MLHSLSVMIYCFILKLSTPIVFSVLYFLFLVSSLFCCLMVSTCVSLSVLALIVFTCVPLPSCIMEVSGQFVFWFLSCVSPALVLIHFLFCILFKINIFFFAAKPRVVCILPPPHTLQSGAGSLSSEVPRYVFFSFLSGVDNPRREPVTLAPVLPLMSTGPGSSCFLRQFISSSLVWVIIVSVPSLDFIPAGRLIAAYQSCRSDVMPELDEDVPVMGWCCHEQHYQLSSFVTKFSEYS